uniref:Putative ovule protein n=1 Tax=Solanum chacoense TaxID=4108 RepID=A0A0V0HJR2_SOLCH
MDKLVDSQQMAFIQGIQIMDAVLIANEAVDSRISQKMLGILCKLDIGKAYDHVNWGFLINTLKRMGFGEKWIKWIRFCISTVKFSVVINGSPEGFFAAQRGIRQGDPLSPFPFILAVEGLNNMIKTTKVNGWLSGFEVAKNNGESLEVTHLQYADDIIGNS